MATGRVSENRPRRHYCLAPPASPTLLSLPASPTTPAASQLHPATRKEAACGWLLSLKPVQWSYNRFYHAVDGRICRRRICCDGSDERLIVLK